MEATIKATKNLYENNLYMEILTIRIPWKQP